MRLKAALEGKGEHLVIDLGRIADAEHMQTTVDQFLRNPVDCHIALGTHQHLVLPPQGLIDGLDKRGGLTRSGRAMHDGHILGSQHLVDRLLLRAVEEGIMQGSKGEGFRLL